MEDGVEPLPQGLIVFVQQTHIFRGGQNDTTPTQFRPKVDSMGNALEFAVGSLAGLGQEVVHFLGPFAGDPVPRDDEIGESDLVIVELVHQVLHKVFGSLVLVGHDRGGTG